MTIRLNNLKTRKYGDWEILEEVPQARYGEHKRFLCQCKCGETRKVYWYCLRTGKSTKCRSCSSRRSARTHGMSGSKIHNIWRNMHYRCKNKNSRHYKNYGGRGITICERWNDFEKFYADMGDRPENFSIERLDNNAGYSPENCIWADHKTQALNRRNSIKIQVMGGKFSLAEISGATGVPRPTLYSRFVRNGSIFIEQDPFGLTEKLQTKMDSA